MRKSLLSLVCFFALALSMEAHNGKIGFAFPTQSIKIDGESVDWSEKYPTYEISEFWDTQRRTYLKIEDACHFRVAYRGDTLILGLEVLHGGLDSKFRQLEGGRVSLLLNHLDNRENLTIQDVTFSRSNTDSLITNIAFGPNCAEVAIDLKTIDSKISTLREGTTIGFGIEVLFSYGDNLVKLGWGKGNDKAGNYRHLGDLFLMDHDTSPDKTISMLDKVMPTIEIPSGLPPTLAKTMLVAPLGLALFLFAAIAFVLSIVDRQRKSDYSFIPLFAMASYLGVFFSGIIHVRDIEQNEFQIAQAVMLSILALLGTGLLISKRHPRFGKISDLKSILFGDLPQRFGANNWMKLGKVCHIVSLLALFLFLLRHLSHPDGQIGIPYTRIFGSFISH